jgi:hypothetical protein
MRVEFGNSRVSRASILASGADCALAITETARETTTALMRIRMRGGYDRSFSDRSTALEGRR